MMFYLSPTSARPTQAGFPFPPNPHAGRPQARPSPFDYGYPNHEIHEHHHYPYSNFPGVPYSHVDVDAAVERAAREYASAQRRAQALEQERLRRVRAIQEHRRRLEEQRRAQAQAEAFAEMAAAMEQLAATRQSRRAQMYEEYERAKAEEVVRFQATLRRQQEAEIRRREEAQNAFLDALGLRHSEPAEPRRVPVMPQPQPVPSPKATTPQERLRHRLEVDEDAEVQEVIENLLNLFVPSAPAYSQEAKPADTPVNKDKGKARESPVAFPWEMHTKSGAEPNNVNEAARTVRFNVPVTTTPAAPRQPTPPTSIPTPTQAEHTNLRRVPAMRRSVATQLSLGAIDRISTLFQELKSSFVFPTDLDHSRSSTPSPVTPDSDSAQLPFTSKNKPVHVYEHALNGLLAKLDEVDSHGDEEVRRRRKEVVLEVEKALAEVDRKVAEASPKLEKSSLPEESEVSPLSTAPVVAEAAVISTEAETKPEVAEEVHIASSEVSRPPLVTEESVPAATQSEATEEDTQTTDTTSSVVVDSEAVLDAVSVVSGSEDVPTSSGIHTDSIVNSGLSANAEALEEASEGEDTVVPENPSTDVAIRESELEVLPPTVESAAPATPCEAAPALVRTPTLLSEITSSSKDAKAIEEDYSTATTSPLPVPASEPTSLSVVESADTKQSIATEDDIPSPETESAFLLESHPQEDDQSYIRAKARAAASKEGEVTSDWESAELSSVSDVDVDGDAWSEVE